MILYERNTGRCPGSGLSVLPFVPATDFAVEYHCATVGVHSNIARIEACTTAKSIFYFRLDIGADRLWRYRDIVGKAFHSAQMSDGSLSSLSLVPEIHLPAERDPAVVDGHFDA